MHEFSASKDIWSCPTLKKGVSLDNKTWESQLPKRPALRLYDEGEEEEKKATSDDENEPVWGRSHVFAVMSPV